MTGLFTVFANNLLPLFLAAGVGYLLGKRLHIDPRPVSQMIFYALSPCLIFTVLTQSQLNNSDILRMGGFALANLLIVGALAWGVTAIFKLERKLMAAVVLTAMLPNAGNLGLSINLFSFGEDALAHASVYFAVSATLMYTLGVFIASAGTASLRQSLVELVKAPTVYAVILAVLFLQMDWTLPLPLERTVNTLGQATIPVMLLLLGLQFHNSDWDWQPGPLLSAAGMRILLSPLVGLGLCVLFNMQGPALQAALSESAVPTAVTATLLATQFDVKPTFVTNVVFFTTMVSPLTITPILALLGG